MARSAPWAVGAYLVVVLAPLALAATQPLGRGLVVNLSVALGFAGLAVLGLQLPSGARLPFITRRLGVNAAGRYHRQIGLLAVLTCFGHPALLFLAAQGYRPLLNIAHDPLRAQLAWLATAALLLLLATSIWRKALHLPYAAWLVLHSLLSLVIVAGALGHALLVDYYTSVPAVRIAWIVYGASFAWLTLYIRLIRPLLLTRRRWIVTGLHPEPGDSLTVTLQPLRKRHAAKVLHRFRAGQFAWLHAGRNPFALTARPFSLSSSAVMRGQLEFTIKRVGPVTRGMRSLAIGDPIHLDGPHGALTIDRSPGPGFVFLAAGVGVTPFLSMLATLADQREKRPVLLFLGNRRESAITGVRQLHGLASRLDLTVVHVISRPSTAWTGQGGRITATMLAFYLPDGYQDLEYFVCASPKVAGAYLRALRQLGVPGSHIHSEQF